MVMVRMWVFSLDGIFNFVTQSFKADSEIGLSIWLTWIDRFHDGLKHIHIALECDPAF